jgi:CubicO group peptidase (beta-lactamase class C family)
MKKDIDFINFLNQQPKLRSGLEPGLTAVVLKKNQVVWQKCRGLADLGRRIPITPKTNFRLASLSKQFTAMAAMILAQRKKLSLENKLTDFFPDYPAYGNKVTVRQLLTHTAGIPDHEKQLYQKIRPPRGEPTMVDTLEVLKNQPDPLFTPGNKYQYSDAGYVLLALIIEKVSGLSYRNFLKQNIFSPLGMTNSDVLDQTKPKINNRVLGYKNNDGKNFEVFDYDPLNYIVGDEGVYSSIYDMAKWSRAWDEEILVNRKSLVEAMSPARLANGRFGKAGFSWLIKKFRGIKIIYQDGSWVGFRNIILKIPARKLTVIVLSNRTDLDTETKRISAVYSVAQKFF